MVDITLYKLNEVYLRVDCSDIAVERKLSKWFSVRIPNAHFSPAYKQGKWNGIISFFNEKNSTLPIGMLKEFFNFCDFHKFTYGCSFDHTQLFEKMSDETFEKMTNVIFKDSNFTLRDYQKQAIQNSIKRKRGIVLSATGSGKSIVIYVLTRYLLACNRNILLVVPTTALVSQMFSDFVEYGWSDAAKFVCRLYSGMEYDESKPVLISTWQSLYKKESSFFDRFGGLMVDECVNGNSQIECIDGKKSIKKIEIGELVWSLNEETGKKELKKVEKVFEKQCNSIIFSIETEDGLLFPEGISGNHEVKTQRGWIRVDELLEGDELIEF